MSTVKDRNVYMRFRIVSSGIQYVNTLVLVGALTSFSINAFAGDVPQSFTLDGKLYSNAAGTTALVDGSIGVKVQILDDDQICVLYEEQQTVSTTSTSGYFSVHVGTNTGDPKRTAGDVGNTMAQVFQNMSTINGKKSTDGTACTAAIVAGKKRFVRVVVSPSTMGSTPRTLTPDLTLDSVPNAVVAERAESLQGYRSSDMLKVNSSGSNVLTQNNLESLFTSPTRFTALNDVVDGTSSMFVRSSAAGAAQLPVVAGIPASPAMGALWYDSSDNTLKYRTNLGANAIIGTSGSSQWTTTGSDIYYNTGKVGIGTATPGTTLQVNGGSLFGGTAGGTNFFNSSYTNTLGIYGASNSNSLASGIQLGDGFSAASRQWGIYNGRAVSGQVNGSLNFVVSSAANTDALAGTTVMNISSSGNVGIGTTAPTAVLNLKAGTAAAGTAPLKLTSGTNLTTPEAGAIEYNGTNLYFTNSALDRRSILTSGSLNSAVGMDQYPDNSTVYTSTSGTLAMPPVAQRLVQNTSNVAGTATTYVAGTRNATGDAYSYFGSVSPASGYTPDTVFGQSTGAGSYAERMRIDSSGNVGIGTSSPSSKLHLSNGAILASGTTGSTPVSGAGTRMMWIPAKAAFRAGQVTGTQWDDANIGSDSTAIGNDSKASGSFSTAIGYSSTASNSNALALGFDTNATGSAAIAMGFHSNATGNYAMSVALGTTSGVNPRVSGNSSLGIFLGDQGGTDITASNVMVVLGGNVGIGTSSPTAALNLKAGTATAGTAPLKLTSGTNLTTPEAGAIEFDGTNLYYTNSANARQTIATSGGGTVTSVSVTAPVTNSGTATAPNINVSVATTAATGVVQLASNGGTTASTVVQATDSRLSDSRGPNGSASGDLSGTYPGPTVAKIQGVAVAATAPTTGQVLKLVTGAPNTWTPSNFGVGDLLTAAGAQQFGSSSCTSSETLTWSALTNAFSCTAISGLPASVISSGTISTARLGSGTADGTTYLRGDGTWATAGGVTSITAGTGLTGGTITTTGTVAVDVGTSANQIPQLGSNKELQTAGQVASAVYDNGSSTSFDFNNGNMQYTSANCGAITLSNMLNGGTYTVAVKGTTPATCSFTHAGLTFKFVPAPSNTSGETIFSFVRMGSIVYTTWLSGF